MPHARTLPADPIHAAIKRHRAAYDAFQVAPDETADLGSALAAEDDYTAATDALAIMPCATRFGALALLTHLRWWLAEEAEFKAGHQPGYGIAEARVADLTLFLGTNLPPVAMPRALPLGRLAPAVEPVRTGIAHRRVRRFLDAGAEMLTAVALIAGGVAAYGFLPFA